MPKPWIIADQPNRYTKDYSEVGGGAGFDLPPHLAGVRCSKCGKPLLRSKEGPISCKLDREGKPVCLRESCT